MTNTPHMVFVLKGIKVTHPAKMIQSATHPSYCTIQKECCTLYAWIDGSLDTNCCELISRRVSLELQKSSVFFGMNKVSKLSCKLSNKSSKERE